VCVEMTATSTATTLAKNVVLTLSTVDGTGMYYSNLQLQQQQQQQQHPCLLCQLQPLLILMTSQHFLFL
jgi:hypothetical protein